MSKPTKHCPKCLYKITDENIVYPGGFYKCPNQECYSVSKDGLNCKPTILQDFQLVDGPGWIVAPQFGGVWNPGTEHIIMAGSVHQQQIYCDYLNGKLVKKGERQSPHSEIVSDYILDVLNQYGPVGPISLLGFIEEEYSEIGRPEIMSEVWKLVDAGKVTVTTKREFKLL